MIVHWPLLRKNFEGDPVSVRLHFICDSYATRRIDGSAERNSERNLECRFEPSACELRDVATVF
jgi:hypothetical protein